MGCVFSTAKDPAAATYTVGAGAHEVSNADQVDETLQALMGYETCTAVVDLHVSCRKLPNRDGFRGKSDPFCVLFEEEGSRWVERARTEVQINQPDPVFVQSLRVRYNFEKRQPMRVEVYDADEAVDASDVLALKKHDFLGSASFLLAEVASHTGSGVVLSLDNSGGAAGVVELSAEEAVAFKKTLNVTISAEQLFNLDTKHGISDPFVRVSRPRELPDGLRYQPVLTTAVMKNTLDPNWGRQEVALSRLCAGDLDTRLLWEVLDWNSSGRHGLIGSAKLSITGLLQLCEQRQPLRLTSPPRTGASVRAKAAHLPPGSLRFANAAISETYSFLDFLRAGLMLDFSVAVDFTASNGHPSDPNSLHFGGETPYEAAIRGVGSIIDHYNTDKMYAAWAFGARVQHGPTSHCYPLNGSFDNPNVCGTAGVLQAYRALLCHATLSGPTNFSPVINRTADAVRSQAAAGRYACLLILTDGEITDMEATIEALVKASTLPMSVLIVGVGSSSFTSMDQLDSDRQALRAPGGRTACRDIVQFVPFSKFAGDGRALAAQVLAEMPGQVVAYMRCGAAL